MAHGKTTSDLKASCPRIPAFREPANTFGAVSSAEPDAGAVAHPLASTVLITGASGYLGEHLITQLATRGYQVNALTRRPDAIAPRKGVRLFRYRMGEGADDRALDNVQAVVHAAANTRGEPDTSDKAERSAAVDLLDLAERFGVTRFIYVSSLAASADGSGYGRLKWRIERDVLQRGGLVVRPGLVYGGTSGGGLFRLLDQLTATSPCIPAFLPSPRVYPIHIDDICQAIVNLVSGKETGHAGTKAGVFTVAQQESVSLNTFLRRLVWHRHHRHPVPIPLPSHLVTLAKAIPLVPRHLAARLDGFAQLGTRKERLRTQCEELAIVPRPLADGLVPTGGARRNLLEEGLALTAYAAGGRPRPLTLRRYARAIERSSSETRISRCLDLRPIFVACPRLLRLLDERSPILRWQSRERQELSQRLSLAVALAEADPHTAPSFHWRTGSTLLAFTGLLLHLLCDLLLQAFSALSWASQWIRRKLS